MNVNDEKIVDSKKTKEDHKFNNENGNISKDVKIIEINNNKKKEPLSLMEKKEIVESRLKKYKDMYKSDSFF